jgi:hypothetical protein
MAKTITDDLTVHINTDDGKKHRVETPSDTKAEQLLQEIVRYLKLPPGGWVLDDKETGAPLDLSKTLEENGVRSGQDLFLRLLPTTVFCSNCGFENVVGFNFCRKCGEPPLPSPPPDKVFHFHLHTPDGSDHSIETPAGMTGKELVEKLVSNPKYGLHNLPRNGRWFLDDKENGTRLDLKRTLVENRVADEHHLYLTRSETHFHWTNVLLGAGILLLVIFVGHAIYQWTFGRVVIEPSNHTIKSSGHQKFDARTRGKSESVRWSIDPAMGVISADGFYSGPGSLSSRQTVTIRAGSLKDGTELATTTLTLEPSGTSIRLSLSQGSAILTARGSASFVPTVTGTRNTAVRWSLSPEVGAIAGDGTYSAPAAISEETTVTVTATSVADPAAFTKAFVTLKPVLVTVNVPRNELFAGESLRAAAVVAGTSDPRVRWSISPNVGYISKNGVYFAPSTVLDPQAVTIKASSVLDPTRSATAIVRLKPVIAISLLPNAVNPLGPGQRLKFSASVSGSSNTAIQWSLAGSGNLSQDGWYIAPSSIANDQLARVTATSVADPGKSASAAVSLKAIFVTISPASVDLFGSQSRRFIANVVGTANTGVRWSISPLRGTISPQGEYFAPITILTNQVISVTATSLADPSKFTTATINLRKYEGPQTGMLIWSGKMEKDGVVVIEGNQIVDTKGPTLGLVQGDRLPGLPVKVSIAKENSKDFAIEQAPGPSNGWRRLSVRSKKSRQAVVRITWTIVQ